MSVDFYISTDSEFWPGLDVGQRTVAALTLRETASRAFYGVSFAIQGKDALSLQERHCEALSRSVGPFLTIAARRIVRQMKKTGEG